MSFGSNDSSTLVTPTSEFEAPFSWKRTGSIDPQEVRHPRFPDYTGRRGSAAGQHDLVIQAQKGLGPTVSQGQKYPSRKALGQFDLQTQSRYGHGPTVSYNEPPAERRKSSAQHDLLTQAVYGHGMTVPVSQEIVEAPKANKTYSLGTQAHLTHSNVKDLRNPWGNKRDFTGQSYDLSSQYRNLQ